MRSEDENGARDKDSPSAFKRGNTPYWARKGVDVQGGCLISYNSKMSTDDKARSQ